MACSFSITMVSLLTVAPCRDLFYKIVLICIINMSCSCRAPHYISLDFFADIA
ncbi:hypothetical protein HMPREF9554_00659 [Treponema phagedenis F0421]|nr:hypothetical protein HMPREF9554_00659 [Treponema phagedenis F0421]